MTTAPSGRWIRRQQVPHGRRRGDIGFHVAGSPGPTNASRLGGTDVYRLLLGDYRALYEVQDKTAAVEVLTVGRSDQAR
ncbi:hypothetical protein GCM10014715_44190 [Streptomyces spiralis]|uniref:Type II toxin-antitoxin system RelE/ParE family toxin n=1 Tax=Streptomyces spiralis TaxID=66376 RepID=A0A919A3C3_9ACTN|nr:type II toxin-antitoxin system RelE/ParE family toxin [Streptomyces spiralis]GHE83566.1 hypothetical protein GCM10014715_44190 [Streptomyces spiralis]